MSKPIIYCAMLSLHASSFSILEIRYTHLFKKKNINEKINKRVTAGSMALSRGLSAEQNLLENPPALCSLMLGWPLCTAFPRLLHPGFLLTCAWKLLPLPSLFPFQNKLHRARISSLAIKSVASWRLQCWRLSTSSDPLWILSSGTPTNSFLFF